MTINKAEIAENTDLTAHEGEWMLAIGCHKGTVISRDSTATKSKFYGKRGNAPLNSLDDCIECAKDYAEHWQSWGSYIWYAHAFSPSGEKFSNLVPSVRYS